MKEVLRRIQFNDLFINFFKVSGTKTSFNSLFQLDHEDTCVNFTIERWYPVANMSRYLPIRVYDYYAPGKTS